MGKPRCAICGREISYNQHYFIMMGRTVCRDDALKIRAKRYEIKNDTTDGSTNISNNTDSMASVG